MSFFRASAEECNVNGIRALERGKHWEAVGHFAKACKRGETEPGHWYNLGFALLLCGDPEAAHDALLMAESLGMSEARDAIDEQDWCALVSGDPAADANTGIGQLLGYAVAEELGAHVGNFLEDVLIASLPTVDNRQSASLARVSIIGRVQTEVGPAAQVAVDFEVANLMWRSCELRLYAYHSDGTKVRNAGGDEMPLPAVCRFVPPHRRTSVTGVVFQLPHSAFPGLRTDPGVQVDVQVYGPHNVCLASSTTLLNTP